MQSLFPYRGAKFDKNQIEFFAAVCIASFIDHVQTQIPARWFGLSDEEEASDYQTWLKRKLEEMRPEAEVPGFVNDTLELLGWNLSILYAQLSGEGLGTMEALQIRNTGAKLEQWAYDRLHGNIGVTRDPHDHHLGKDNIPDASDLARKWVEDIWQDLN